MQRCPECGEKTKGKYCSCGWRKPLSSEQEQVKHQYAKYCQQVRDFFTTPKGKELKALSDEMGKNLSLASQGNKSALKSLKDAWDSLPDGDCSCESGIIFWHQKLRYKIGRCDVCRDPQRPEYIGTAKIWNPSRETKEFSYADR